MIGRKLTAHVAGLALLLASALASAQTAPPPKSHASPAKAAPAGDTTPPVIAHTPIKTVEVGAVTRVEAKISDPSGVFAPKILVRPAGKTAFTPYDFGLVRGDEYTVQLPPDVSAGGSFAYYLEAFDGNGNGPSRSGTPRAPHEVVAVAPPQRPVRVSVRCEPAATHVTIDDKPAGKAPLSLQLMPGRHTLLLAATGRRSLEQQLELVAGRDVEVVAALRTEGGTGRLRIESAPAGAKLFVDGTPAGTAPFETTGLEGTHHLRAVLEGYLPEERTVSLETTRDAEVAFALRQLPATPAVAIESTPTGASVRIDGNERGVTPWLGLVGEGEHEVVLTGAGGRAVSTSFTMTGKNDVLLRLTLPEPRADRASVLAVTTAPPGAEVLLDGQPVGRTPWIGALPKKDVDLAVRLDGYEPVVRHLQAEDHRDRELSLVLARAQGPAVLAIVATPKDAALTLDGRPVGTGQAALEVEPGDHEVAGTRAGRTIAQLVHVEPGQQLAVTLNLPAAGPGHATPLFDVESSPTGATVLLDGQAIGTTPLSYRALRPGRHAVELRADHREPYRTTVTVPHAPDYEVRLAVVLPSLRGLVERPVATKREVIDAQLERGTDCFSTKDWACAADAFTRAYGLEPETDYLYLAALAEANGAQWPQAAAHAKTVAADAQEASLRKQAKALLARCEKATSGGQDAAAPAADTTPPGLAHLPVPVVYRQRPVVLTARLTDDSGIFLPQACWRSLLAPQWQCGGLEKGPHDAYALTVPGSAVSLGFAYFLEAFDINGNGPARAGSPDAPLVATLEEAPATLAALAGVAGAEPLAAAGTGFFASRSIASLTALGIGAAAALGAIATLGLSFSKVAGDEIDAANVHSTTQVQAASARTLSQVGLGLTATAAVGLGAGLFVFTPEAGAGGGVGLAGTF